MRNIKLFIQFDGTNYHGWQVQPNANTVQSEVSRAVSVVVGENIKVIGCSRTDAGVHAKCYVCSFKTASPIPEEKLPFAINAYLPPDIVCFCAEEVSSDFHAIASTRRKRYIYRIENSKIPDPFLRNRVWNYKGALDVSKMQEAAVHFLGMHDFVAFSAAGAQVKSTVRTIFEISVKCEGNIITVDVLGDGFLYNMVRIITGTLVWVGLGKIQPSDIPDIINSKKRENAGVTAPPDGLYLWEVEY